MKQTPWMPLAAVLCAAGLLTSCAAEQKHADTSSGFTSPEEKKDSAPAASFPEVIGTTSGEFAPESFENIEIAVKSPDIQIRYGESFSIRYHLHDREPVRRAEVSGDTLYFETGIDLLPDIDFDDFTMEIIIPDRETLGRVHLSTAAGDITLSDLTFSDGSFKSISGEIELSSLFCDTLEAESVSDEISLMNIKADTLRVKTTSDDISVSGSFGTADLTSVSGDCDLSGEVTASASAETVSGSVAVQLPFLSVTAESFGSIDIDGKKQGFRYQAGDGAPSLRVKSVSGDIDIRTK